MENQPFSIKTGTVQRVHLFPKILNDRRAPTHKSVCADVLSQGRKGQWIHVALYQEHGTGAVDHNVKVQRGNSNDRRKNVHAEPTRGRQGRCSYANVKN